MQSAMNARDLSRIHQPDPRVTSTDSTGNVQKSAQLLLAVVCDNLETAVQVTPASVTRTSLRLIGGGAA